MRRTKNLLRIEAAPHFVTYQLVEMERRAIGALPPAHLDAEEDQNGVEEIGHVVVTPEGAVIEESARKSEEDDSLHLTQEQFAEIGELSEKLIHLGVWTDQGDARAFLRQVVSGATSRHDLNRYQAGLVIEEMKRKLPPAPSLKIEVVTAEDIPF